MNELGMSLYIIKSEFGWSAPLTSGIKIWFATKHVWCIIAIAGRLTIYACVPKCGMPRTIHSGPSYIWSWNKLTILGWSEPIKSAISDIGVYQCRTKANETSSSAIIQNCWLSRKPCRIARRWDTVQDNSFEKEFKYLKISPEKFKTGDLFLRAPKEGGEFFDHKEAIKILSITLPKDGRGNTAIIKTKEEGDIKLSHASLYNIARKK